MKRSLTFHYIPFPSAANEQSVQTIGKISGSALCVHWLLQAQPVLSIAGAGEELKLSARTAIASLKQTDKLGIARETTGLKFGRIYAYDKYQKMLNDGSKPLILGTFKACA